MEVFIGIVTAALGSRRPGGGSGTTNRSIVHFAPHDGARAVAVKAAPRSTPRASTCMIAVSRPALRQG